MLVDLLLELLDWFSWAHAADRRPEARRLTLGCAAIVLLVCAAVIVWVAFAAVSWRQLYLSELFGE